MRQIKKLKLSRGNLMAFTGNNNDIGDKNTYYLINSAAFFLTFILASAYFPFQSFEFRNLANMVIGRPTKGKDTEKIHVFFYAMMMTVSVSVPRE
jgi:hypothetical protein